MSINVARAAGHWWVVDGASARRVDTTAQTTADLLRERAAVEASAAGAAGDVSPIVELELDSPVTAPCRVVAQMVNYRSHARESGFDPGRIQPTFFRKASTSVVGPHAEILRPAHVRLLDYEVELGLVMGTEVPVGTTVTADTLHEVVAGLVMTNDVSARDVQLTKGQFYESKSYPTFTPTGPYLTLVDAADLRRLVDLRLRLSVDRSLRQDRTVADMIHPPAPSLTSLLRFQNLATGDVVLTGTPGGTALQAPPHIVELVAGLLPPATKWRIFFDKQAKNPRYLRAGNRVTATIRTADGAIDLGEQSSLVVDA